MKVNRFQCSISASIMAMIAVALILGWMSPGFQAYRQSVADKEAAERFRREVSRLGGSVTGTTRFEVDMRGSPATDSELAAISWHRNVVDINLEGTSAARATLAAIVAECSNLRFLEASLTQLSDDDGDLLRGFTRLQSLGLTQTAVGDRVIQSLSEHASLQEILLAGTKVTSDGVAALSKISSLQRVVIPLSDPQVVRELKTQRPELSILMLESSEIEH